jgi:hypothetical protein
MTDEHVLPYRGERFTQECGGGIRYERWQRNVLAPPIVRGKKVLEAACGERYGSAIPALSMSSVVGVDGGTEAISPARERYWAMSAKVQVEIRNCEVARLRGNLVSSDATLKLAQARLACRESFMSWMRLPFNFLRRWLGW